MSRPPVGYVKPAGCTGLNCVPWHSYHAPSCALRLAQEAAPVAPADHGNHCACGAALPVEAPLYRGPSGSIICAACADALERVAPKAPPPAMVTSVLMRRAAQLLDEIEHYHRRPSQEVRIIAHELRERAALVEREARVARRSCGVVHAEGCELLRAIGEVHS